MNLKEIFRNVDFHIKPEKYETRGRRNRRILNYASLFISSALMFFPLKCTYDKIYEPQTPAPKPRILFDERDPYSPNSKKDDIHVVGDKGGTEIGDLKQLDPNRHKEEARKINYETSKDAGRAPSKIGDRKRNVEPTLEETVSKEDGYLNFERQTSYIQPRPAASIDESVRDAIIFLDVSGSMVNYASKGINIPAVAGIAIAQYYINERGASVVGAIFNKETAYTGFTRDLDKLAKLFSKYPDGGTILDAKLFNTIASANRTNASNLIDLYIISDLELANINQVIGALDKSKFGRIYILEVGSNSPGTTTKIFGKDAYRAPLNNRSDLYDFYKKFRQDNINPKKTSAINGNIIEVGYIPEFYRRNPHNIHEIARLPGLKSSKSSVVQYQRKCRSDKNVNNR